MKSEIWSRGRHASLEGQRETEEVVEGNESNVRLKWKNLPTF